jgi:hypothetical protein
MKSKSTPTSTLLVVVALLFAGCTNTRVVFPGDPADRSVARLNRVAQKGNSLLVNLDDRSLSVKQLQVGSDSTTWFTLSGEFEVVATHSIRSVSYVNHRQGALIGIVAGALVGTAIGVGMSRSFKDDPPCSETDFVCIDVMNFSAESKKVIALTVLGGGGGIIGVGIGDKIGREYIYKFEPPPPIEPILAGGRIQPRQRR